jgi:drug/metabolite transporter (DMT)-like permease
MIVDNKSKRAGAAYVTAAAIMWGGLPIFSRYAYMNGSDPITAAAMRSYIAALAFFVWFLIDGTFKKVSIKDVPFYLFYGLVSFGGASLCYMISVNRLSTSMAAMLLYTSSGFVVVLNWLIYKEPITKLKFIALICTFGGCFLVVRGYDLSLLTINMRGILIGLASGLCYSLTTVVGHRAKEKYSGRTNAGLMVIFGMIIFLVLRPPWQIPMPTLPEWTAYLGLAIPGTVLGYMLYLKGLDTELDGGLASIMATTEPIVATILGFLLFYDRLEFLQLVGIAIALFGVVLPIIVDRKTNTTE